MAELTKYGDNPTNLPGATRIGTVWLHVPPINVHYNSPKMETVMNTMRQQSSNHIKTGRAMHTFDMDLVFSGVAMINDKLAPLIAQIRRTPFTVLYNQTVYNIANYSSDPTSLTDNEVPIAITGYTIHTELDLPDTLIMRLSFMVFNYSTYVQAIQYMKQTLDTAGNPIFTTPAHGIEDSNLFFQYYNSLIADGKTFPDFMFSGELEQKGQITDGQWNDRVGDANPIRNLSYSNEFVTRIDPQANAVVKNGSKIKKISTSYSAGNPETFTIGYHVITTAEALDLSIGAYKSRRLKKWIYTSNDLRTDIITTLNEKNVPFASTAKNEQLIQLYLDFLSDVAVVNVADKYIKQYTIASDKYKNIEGIAVRRMIPITVLPIVSSPIPTCQYMGGADTEVSITIYTNDEDFINTLTTVDQTIERSQRNLYRHAGSELTYLQNDIVNLNGTFVVTNGNIDIQNIPDNPGSYIVTWSFTEQGEVLKALTNLPSQIKNFKKNFVKAIIESPLHQKWTFEDNYGQNYLEFPTPLGASGPSYIHTVVIPSMVRAVRNGFIKYARQNPATYRNVIQSPTVISSALYSPSLNGAPPPALTNPANGPALPSTPASPNSPSTMASPSSNNLPSPSSTAVSTGVINASSAPVLVAFAPTTNVGVIAGETYHAWDATWQIITTGETDIPDRGSEEAELYALMGNWLASKSTDAPNGDMLAQIQDGFAECIINSTQDRLELVLNSPNLLQYEIDWMTGQANSTSVGNANLTVFKNALDQLNCYPDLGLPFDYVIEDNNGAWIFTPGSTTQYQTQRFYDPDFYTYSGPAIAPGNAKLNAALNPSDPKAAVKQIKASIAQTSNQQSNSQITGGTGNYLSSNHLTHTQATNGINHRDPSVKLGDTDPTNTPYENIARTNLQNTIKDNQNNLQSTPLDTLRTYSKVSSFKNDNDLYFSDQLIDAMGSYGSETSDGTIAEAQLEHKIIKSTLSDMNPDIEASLAYIINDARQSMLQDPKFYSMNKGYPTFRLFFKIEQNPQWFLFDELFDFRAVESIRYYKDKISPTSTVSIVLNNYNNILTDLKALMAKQNFKATNTNTTAAVTNQYTDQPLHTFFVQPGTQIQLKIGYSGQDTNMPIVFNGFVSEVSPGERFEILCQGYGIELLTDSGINSFIGWVCNAKQLIWWMLLGSDTKHLGGNWQPSLIPHGIKDFLSGWWPKDQNIYLSEEDEPGKLRFLQSYNADNMTKWDVLQDLAAANPGYVCQVVPFFNTETIFFGHPDHLYTYTQDMGIQVPGYPVLSSEQIASLVGTDPDVNLIDNAPTKSLNWVQWTNQNTIIKQSYETWLKTTWGSYLNTEQGQQLILYCKYVEMLSQLATDPNNGNIQYNLFDIPVPPSVASTFLVPNTATITPVQAATQPVSSAAGISSSAQAATPNQGNTTPAQNNSNVQIDADTKQARLRKGQLATDTSKSMASQSNGELWSKLPPDQQVKLASSLIGPTIKLNEFDMSTGSNIPAMNLILTSMPGLLTLDPNNPATLAQVQTINNVVTNYLSTHNETDAEIEAEIEAESANVGFVNNIIEGINLIYQKYGIGSVLAIACWYRIQGILLSLANESANTLSQPADNSPANAPVLASIPANQAALGRTIVNAGAIQQINLPLFGLSITTSNTTGTPAANGGVVQFNAPINTTDLKAHQALRQLILSKVINVSPVWQDLLNTLGKSPIQKRFRQHFIKTSYRDIVNNDIRTSLDNMWNRVKVKYKRKDLFDIYIPIPSLIGGDKPNDEFIIQAGQTLDERITRQLVVPVENARTVWQARNYATSILAEGIRNMYTGTLTITGDPNIKPYDIIMIYDDYNKMYGPIEVKSISHIMSAESGFISIIEPQCCVDPLGVSLSWATKLFKIFETTLIAAVVLPFAIEAGIGLGIGALAAEAVEGGSAAKSFASITELFGGILSKGSAATDTVIAGAKGVVGVGQTASEVAYGESITANVTAKLGETGAEKIAATASQLSGGATTYTAGNLGGIPTNILKEALQINGVSKNTINFMLLRSNTKGITSGLVSAISSVTAVTPTTVSSLSSALGLTTLNIIKSLAILSVPIYYQLFAGIDDSNYACPLKITCLRLNDEPYFAGIDSLTHQSGIWNYVKGQFFKVIGSVRTINDWVTEQFQAWRDSF